MDLRRRGLPSAGILLFLSAGILACASSGFTGKTAGQDQPERSKFYALQVVCEKQVQNAKDSLGAPDGRSTEILPGGQLIVLMANILFPSRIIGNGESTGCLDSGSLVGKGEVDFGLVGRFTWQDTQSDQRHEWIPLGPTATGFCISPPPLAINSFKDSAGVDMIRITNPGTKSLFVDAVIGYGRDVLMTDSHMGHLPRWPAIPGGENGRKEAPARDRADPRPELVRGAQAPRPHREEMRMPFVSTILSTSSGEGPATRSFLGG